MNRLTIIALAAATGLAFATASSSAQTYRWDLPNGYDAGSIHSLVAEHFAEALHERSRGEIEITLKDGGALGYTSLDQYDAVGDGAVVIASSYVGPWAGLDPIYLLSSLPFLARSFDEVWALYQAAKPSYEADLAASNQVLLLATPWPPSGIWGREPIDSVEKVRGLRIRTYDANGTITLREAGAVPDQLSWADVVPQLATGRIDAVLTSADGGAAGQLWEHLPYFTEVNYASPLQFIHMNKDVHDSLSDALREALHDAAAAAEEYGWGLLADRVEQNYRQMRGNDMIIVTDAPEDFIRHLSDAGKAALDEWKERFPDAEALLADYEERRGG
jgi:TRAP-type transport system periplasmic protein